MMGSMSEVGTVTIAEFLTARLDEDKAVARDAVSRDYLEEGLGLFVCEEQGTHVGTPPARVLAEVEAKRQIVDLWNDAINLGYATVDEWLESAVRLIALPYADHPDYREEWKP